MDEYIKEGSFDHDDVFAVVLAGGLSSRMGRPKPLLDIGGKLALTRLLDSIMAAGVRDIKVVGGYRVETLVSLVESYKRHHRSRADGIKLVRNKRYREGMITSVSAGLEAVTSHKDGAHMEAALIFPVDIPLVSTGVIRAVLYAARQYPGRFIAPAYKGKKGHPVYIPREYFEDIVKAAADGAPGGMAGVMNARSDKLHIHEVGSETCVLEMDTPDEYAELKAWYAAEVSGEHERLDKMLGPDNSLARFLYKKHRAIGGRLFLVRHGSIRKHREGIFLGQSDVPLSNLGREEARMAGERLLMLGVGAGGAAEVYVSPLTRALETANLITYALPRQNGDYIAPRITPAFTEISLGAWDGMYISDVKKSYPEEYAERGKNPVSFKIAGGENFYDLSYRVLKGLVKILTNPPKDIVVVSHAGVIRTILAELQKVDLEEVLGVEIEHGEIIEL